MKKLTTFLTMLSLGLLMSVTAFAATPIKAEGKVATVQGQAQDVKGVQHVYVSQVARKLGYTTKFDTTTKTLTATKGTIVRTFTFGENTYTLNRKQFDLGYRIGITGNELVLPTSYMGIALDCTVDWFAKSKTLSIIPNTNGKQALIVDRLLASGDYTLKTDEYGIRTLTPKDSKAKYTIVEGSLTTSYDTNNKPTVMRLYDASIVTEFPDQYTRAKIKEVLKILLPTSYETVQMYMVTTLRWEVYEYFGEDSFFPGVEFAYHDGRNISTETRDMHSVGISINYQGYKPSIGDPYRPISKRLVDWAPEGIDYFINMWNITEYTKEDYDKIRKPVYEEELNRYYFRGEEFTDVYYLK